METKTIIAGAVALVAILMAAFILLPPPVAPPAQNGEYPNPLGGQNATMEEFANSLMHAETVYLVEDIRGLEKYPISRNNIMQCGVDLAGSEGLVGKGVNIYIIEGNECSASEAGGNLTIKPLSECHAAVASAFGKAGNSVIWIEKGYSPSIYQGGLVVRINETYTQGMCNIRLVVPVEEGPAVEATNGTTGGEGAESVTWEATPEIPAPSESAPGETAPAETAPEEASPIPPHAD